MAAETLWHNKLTHLADFKPFERVESEVEWKDTGDLLRTKYLRKTVHINLMEDEINEIPIQRREASRVSFYMTKSASSHSARSMASFVSSLGLFEDVNVDFSCFRDGDRVLVNAWITIAQFDFFGTKRGERWLRNVCIDDSSPMERPTNCDRSAWISC